MIALISTVCAGLVTHVAECSIDILLSLQRAWKLTSEDRSYVAHPSAALTVRTLLITATVLTCFLRCDRR